MTSLYPAETNSGAVTSWIPLTTTFTPSRSCTSQFRLDGPSLVAFDPGYGLDINPAAAACAPPAVTTWWEQGRLGSGDGQGHTAASLGPMTCPDEWTTVVSSVKDRSSTLEMCCPSGYTLANGIQGSVAGDCESAVSSGQVLTFASTPSDQSTAWTITKTTLADSSIVGAIAVVGWNIAAATPTAKSSRSSTLSSSPTSTPSRTSPLTAATSSSSSGPAPAGLSTGAAVGIGLGVALGVIGIAALLVALWLVRRRRRREAAVEAAAAAAPTAAGNNNTDDPNPPYPPVEYAPKPWQVHELPPSDITPELHAHDAVRPPPAELHGS